MCICDECLIFDPNVNAVTLVLWVHFEVLLWHGNDSYINAKFVTLLEKWSFPLTIFRVGVFGAAHRWERELLGPPLHEICYIYPTMKKFGTVILT